MTGTGTDTCPWVELGQETVAGLWSFLPPPHAGKLPCRAGTHEQQECAGRSNFGGWRDRGHVEVGVVLSFLPKNLPRRPGIKIKADSELVVTKV